MEHACRRRNVVRLSRVLLIAAVVVVLGLVPATVVRASTNLVGNPGFESPLAGTQYEGTISPNFGNWIAYSFRHSIPLPSEVHAPSLVHGGSASGEIVNPAGVGSALFVQDIQSFDPNSTYTFSGWVYPVAGEQYFNLEFGWDRGSAGRTTGGSGINITPTATEFSAWQQSGRPAPALTYNAWHYIQLVVNSATLTSELYVDGSCQGISSAGQPVPGGSPSTILIGDGSGPSSESHFYWDDVELMSGVQVSGCPGGSPSGLVGEWQGNGNANDSVGANNGALLSGAYAPGDGGQQAFELDGGTSYVEIPAAVMQTVTGPISVAADIYPERISPGEEIFSQYDTHDTSTTFSLSVQAGGTLQWEVVGSGCDSLRGDARTIETTSPVLTLDTWTHVAATFEPSTQTLQILVNGSPVSTKLTEDPTVPSLCVSGTPLRIGAGEQFYGGLAGFYQGKIQDVQLYNTDISPTGGGSSSGGGGGGGSLPIADQPIQQVVFVHGIRANCADVGNHGEDYSELYGSLQDAGMSVYTFCYDHDLAFGDHSSSQWSPGRCFSDSSRASGPVTPFVVTRGQETSAQGWNGPLPVTRNAGGSSSSEPNDGDGALVYDAAKLDDCLSSLVSWDKATYGHALPITVIGNSMGGAITRGWLRLASARAESATHDQALEGVTTVDFLQGAVDGSWLAGAAEGTLLDGVDGDALRTLAALASGAAEGSCHGATPGLIGCLDVKRAGIEDLAAGSAWNRAISGPHALAPPHLHYFTYSTDLEVIYHVKFVLWGGLLTIGPKAIPGDGLMELGSESYKTLPPDGGSEFLPFGAAPDQHQYVMKQRSEVSAQGVAYLGGSASRALWVAQAAGAVLNNPYSHFNFGHNIGHLMVNPCDSSLGTAAVSVVAEVTRVFEDPSNACGDPLAAAKSGSASLLRGDSTKVEKRAARPDLCATCASIATAQGSEQTATGAGAPIEFYDRADRAQLALYTSGPLRGRFTLLLKNGSAYFGVLPVHLLRGHTVRLNVTVLARGATSAGGKVSLRLRGVISPATHYARIRIRSAHPKIETELATAGANVAAAKAISSSVVLDLSANKLLSMATLIAPDLRGGLSVQALANEMAAKGVHITHIATTGKGSLHWPLDSNPTWLQPVLVDAAGRAPLRTSLVFEEEAGRWWIVGSTR